MNWKIIDSERLPPAAIMAKDKWLLENLKDETQPILHLYEWEGKSLTYGYFTDPFKFLKADQLNQLNIRMARRPTGGGIIFHLTDLAFSVLVPSTSPYFSLNTLENYWFVNKRAKQAVEQFLEEEKELELLIQEPVCSSPVCHSFCMAKPTQYDIMLEGRKIGGAAQRRTRDGFLHQGSLCLALPPLSLLKAVLKETAVLIEAMQVYSYHLLQPGWSEQQLEQARSRLKQLLIQSIIGRFNH